MSFFKGWKTRIFNFVSALVAFANEAIPLLPALAIDADFQAQVRSWLLIAVLVGNLILRELTDTPAGRAQ